MKRQKQFTITQLEAQMQEALNFIFNANVLIEHGGRATRGGRKLYGEHTRIFVPVVPVTKRQRRAAFKIINGMYRRVKRFVVESGTVQHGTSHAPITRAIRFEYE